MAKDWARRHEFVGLDVATLTTMVQPIFPGKKVVAAQLLTEGFVNTNYKIMLSGFDTPFVLRLYVHDSAACQKDIDLFNLVKEHVPMPEIFYADVDGTRHSATYAVMQWIDGVLLSEVLNSGNTQEISAVAYATGSTLANIGCYKFPQSGSFGPGLSIARTFDGENDAIINGIEHYLFKEQAGQRLGTNLTMRLWQLVQSNIGYLSAIEDVASLVHADYKGINILVRQSSKPVGQVVKEWDVAAVLDWEFAFAGTPLFDIGNMLRYSHLYSPEFEKFFICGFLEHGGHLPANWKKIIKIIDLVNLLDFLNYPVPRGTMIEDVTGLITNTLEHWGDF